MVTHINPFTTLLASAIVLTLKNAIFTPWYTARVLGVQSVTFTRSMLPGIIATLILIVVITVIGRFVPLGNWTSLIFAGGAIALIYCVILLRFGLDRFELGLFRSYLPQSVPRPPASVPDVFPG